MLLTVGVEKDIRVMKPWYLGQCNVIIPITGGHLCMQELQNETTEDECQMSAFIGKDLVQEVVQMGTKPLD